MKASAFEQRYAMVLRLCFYAAAFSVYFFDRVDIVWRFIRDSPSRRALEHGAFLIATLLIGLGAYLCTYADAYAADHGAYLGRRCGFWGDWLYAIGLSTLAPLGGCVILIAGESIRIARLWFAERQGVAANPRVSLVPRWGDAFRSQAAKWGVQLTMVVFTVTLIDRVADYGIAASIAVWAHLNWASIFRRGA